MRASTSKGYVTADAGVDAVHENQGLTQSLDMHVTVILNEKDVALWPASYCE
jgi:hypothetical protein